MRHDNILVHRGGWSCFLGSEFDILIAFFYRCPSAVLFYIEHLMLIANICVEL